MTVATYNTNLADIFTDGATSTWTGLGGGPAGLNQETDYFIQGTSCLSKNAFASSTRGMIHDNSGDAGGSGTDGAYIAWITHHTPGSLDTKAGGGVQFIIGSSSSAFVHYYVGGSDTIEFGGWILAAVNEATAGDQSDTGSPSATVESFFGALWDLPSGGPTKGAPNGIDGIRFGRCDIVIEFGTGADPEATFDGIISGLETASNRYGLFAQREPGGAYENSGLLQLGSSTNAVEFLDGDKVIFLRDHDHVTANFHTWEVQNASSVITLTNLSVKALGTTSPGRWVTTDNATMTWTTCNFTDMGTFGFLSNATIDTCVFLRCAQVTHGGSTLNDSSILASTVAADEGAVLYNEAVDPDGEMDGMSFSQGTNAHHAIRFGTSVPAAMTLRDCDFSGFSSSDDNDGSVFRFDDTSGSITLNLVGCTTDGSGFTVDDAAGVAVTVVIDPVTALVHVDDNTGADLQNARVLMEAADGAGDLPFQESVTITRSGGTATVTHTTHGLDTGDIVVIRGADQPEYNGPFTITVTTGSEYTYTVAGSPDTPATGTIISSGAILSGLTDVNGDISASRTFAADTNVKGSARKSTASPRFKNFSFSGTIDNVTGLTINIRMVSDE